MSRSNHDETVKTVDTGIGKKAYTRPSLIVHGDLARLTQGPRTGHTDGGGTKSSAPSDRNIKSNFAPVDNRDILLRVAGLPIETWNYNDQNPSFRHIGPMAQDFAAAFGVGEDDKHINLVDANGVALAAIQALYEMIQQRDVEIVELRAAVSALKSRLPGSGALDLGMLEQIESGRN